MPISHLSKITDQEDFCVFALYGNNWYIIFHKVIALLFEWEITMRSTVKESVGYSCVPFQIAQNT